MWMTHSAEPAAQPIKRNGSAHIAAYVDVWPLCIIGTQIHDRLFAVA